MLLRCRVHTKNRQRNTGTLPVFNQSMHVAFIIAGILQILQIPANRHIGDTEQLIEINSLLFFQRLSILVFQTGLRTGKVCFTGIMNQIDYQATAEKHT